MKQLLFSLLIVFSILSAHSQQDSVINKPAAIAFRQRDTTTKQIQPVIKSSTSNAPPPSQPKKPELFNSGFIDFQNSGQMNASARVFKIYIGEPKKFMLPLSVYSGVSGNNYNSNNNTSRGSEQMILGLINPMSGIFNLSTDNTFRFTKKTKSLTGFSFVYQ